MKYVKLDGKYYGFFKIVNFFQNELLFQKYVDKLKIVYK